MICIALSLTGMCRFKSVDDAKSAYEAGSRGEIEIDGTCPTIFELQQPVYSPPVSHLITPDTTWESSEEGIEVDDLSHIHLPDPLNSSSHSCELPAIQASNHLMEGIPASVTNEDDDNGDGDYPTPRSMLETSSGTSSPIPNRHHRKRSTAIFDGGPKTYEDTADELFQQRRPTSGVCELQDPSFAEIYRQQELKYTSTSRSENDAVHVLCGVPDQQ